MDPQRQKREGGAALLVAMLMLVLMGMIGLSSLNTVMADRQGTGFQNMAHAARYAADAGVAEGLDVLLNESLSATLAPGDCLVGTIPATSLAGGRSYQADPDSPQICMLASADPCGGLNSINVGQGQPVLRETIWNVRVQGNAPAGATSRVQATVKRCLAFNN